MPVRRAAAPAPVPVLVLLAALALAGCSTPLLDQPAKARENQVVLPPIWWSAKSPDGTSWCWWTAFGLVGSEQESQRTATWVLPFWWQTADPPYTESTGALPFYYARTSPTETSRFYSLLYGRKESDTWRNDYALIPIFSRRASKVDDTTHTTVFPLYDWRTEGGVDDLTLIPLLGLAHLSKSSWGHPAAGERAGAMGREGSRRIELLNLLNIITLGGYDDVGDTREIRALTLFGNESWSPLYSRRGRAPDDPYVREWLFPLYANVGDEDGGWSYVGPLWGTIDDTAAETHTDWWLLGLFSRTTAPAGNTWRVLGLPVSEP